MNKPNVIIAGTNKAGTTSLFRYLASHPDVCCSRVKEIGFFNRTSDPIPEDDWNHYLSHFSDCSDESPVILEASPVYLQGGAKTASLIHRYLPDVKLIFVLREPVSRILSNFSRKKERLADDVKNLDINEHIDNLLSKNETQEGSDDDAWVDELSTLDYAEYIKQYLEILPQENIGIYFFDDLQNDTHNFVADVCEFIGIDKTFYDAYEFHVENKTRSYRSKGLQKMVFRANKFLEPFLNKVPLLRRKIRSLYNLLNESKPKTVTIDDKAKSTLEHHFYVRNQELGKLLKERFPGKGLPRWIPLDGPNG